jgi:hypothetical protein
MPRISAMYAGSSGYSHSINRMAPGMCDNKWQGIAPTGEKRASVVRSIQRRGWGNNYTKVFCFNALSGGVGAKSAMFSSSATGASRNCQGSVSVTTTTTTNNQLTESETLNYLSNLVNGTIANLIIFVPIDEVPEISLTDFTHTNGTVQAHMFTQNLGMSLVYFYDISPVTQLVYNQSVTNTFTKNSTSYKAFYITQSQSEISFTSGIFNPMPNTIVDVAQFLI